MDSFKTLESAIERLLSIHCSSYKEEYIKRRILSRMRVTGKGTFEDYHRHLLGSTEEQAALKNALTINVTKFFRDPEVFAAIRLDVLPNLVKKKRRVHIWCAGCSSGEEAYSLAILLHEQLVLHPEGSGLIYATDIDEKVLKKAKEGIYDAKSLENLRPAQIKRHFSPLPDGRFAVKPHLQELIRFRHHDLMSGLPVARFLDMITCRNVTIYFTEEQKNDLSRMFHSALCSGSYYVIGKTEYLGREVEHLYAPFNTIEKIYAKSE